MEQIETEFPKIGKVVVTGQNHFDALDELGCAAAWDFYCASGKLPEDIPMRPDLEYQEFTTWSDWINRIN